MRSKKSQISIFIIFGIIIISFIVLFLYFNDQLPGVSKTQSVSNIVVYTEACYEDIAARGIFLQKMQGGYINIPERLINRNAYVEIGGFKVPNWYYDGSNYKPSIVQMETELANYIDDNLFGCLNFYKPFLNRFDIVFDELPKTTVKITDSKVSIDSFFPIKIETKGSDEIQYIEEYKTHLNSNLGELYFLASDLNDYENTEFFLEFYTDEMIAASDYLPYSGLELSCKPNYLYESEMKEYTQKLIMHNLKYLQFLNTNYQESGMLYYDKIYKVDFTNNKYNDYKVNVLYNPNWEMDFKALPSKNGVVKPHEFKALNIFSVCMQIYNVRYNTNYPVVFQLFGDNQIDDFFYFSTPVLMKQNQPNRNFEVEPWDIDSMETNLDDPYCDITQEVTNYYLDSNNLMHANPRVVNKRENTLKVYGVDWYHGYPRGVLDNVSINYQCVESRCHIGNTSHVLVDNIIMQNSLPHVDTFFPDCENGIVIAEKEGYHPAFVYQTVNSNTNGEQVTVEMYQLKEFDFNLKVFEESFNLIDDRKLKDDENAIITISNNELKFEQILYFPKNGTKFNDLELLIGDIEYELEIILTKGNYLVGGANLNWTPDVNDLLLYDNVMFNVYRKLPDTVTYSPEDLFKLYESSIESSINYPPRFY